MTDDNKVVASFKPGPWTNDRMIAGFNKSLAYHRMRVIRVADGGYIIIAFDGSWRSKRYEHLLGLVQDLHDVMKKAWNRVLR
jgi:hypothetical protein